MDNFWQFMGLVLWFALIMIWIIIVFQIIGDMMRNHDSSGWAKAGWIFLIIIFPFLGALLYLIVNAKGMAERNQKAMETMKAAQDTYIRQAAGATPAEQISQAKQLLDSGAISQAEYDNLKARALG